MIQITILGDPVAQGRPRFTTIHGRAKAYDPEKSRDYKTYVKMIASEKAPKSPIEGPISLGVEIYRNMPKRFSKAKIEGVRRGEIRPTTKPDADNVLKGIKDALNGVIWKDDSQIVEVRAAKYYSEKPRVEITIHELEGVSSG